eukprot:1419375-Pyramimonas_sp.AAC.1
MRSSDRFGKHRLRQSDCNNGLGQTYSTGQRRGPGNTAWPQAALAEGSESTNQFYMSVFWDLLQFYEHAPWGPIMCNSVLVEFPVEALRLSMSTHAWERLLKYDQILMGPLCPGRGIVAGSSKATFEAMLAPRF